MNTRREYEIRVTEVAETRPSWMDRVGETYEEAVRDFQNLGMGWGFCYMHCIRWLYLLNGYPVLPEPLKSQFESAYRLHVGSYANAGRSHDAECDCMSRPPAGAL